jgi:hypothetical protein
MWSIFFFFGEGEGADDVSEPMSEPNLRFFAVGCSWLSSPTAGVEASLLGSPKAAAEVQPFLALLSQL